MNRQYGPAPAGERFLLLHRRRLWNAAQGVWMGWERKRGKLHELNRLLRGATDTSFVAAGGKPPGRSGRRALRRHARCRYAAAQGCRAPPGRQDGAPTQRAAVRRTQRTCARGVRRAAAADRALAAGRPRRLDLSAPRFERQRHRPVRLGRVGRVPGPVRRGILRRQGHLRRGRVRGGARRPRARQHAAEPRPVRGDLRPRRPGLGRRVRGRVSGALRRRRGSRPPLGTRRLAVAAMGPGPRCARATIGAAGRFRCSAGGRWWTTCAGRSCAPASVLALLVGWILPLHSAAIWTAFVVAMLAIPTLPPVLAGLLPGRSGVSGRSHVRALRRGCATCARRGPACC